MAQTCWLRSQSGVFLKHAGYKAGNKFFHFIASQVGQGDNDGGYHDYPEVHPVFNWGNLKVRGVLTYIWFSACFARTEAWRGKTWLSPRCLAHQSEANLHGKFACWVPPGGNKRRSNNFGISTVRGLYGVT